MLSLIHLRRSAEVAQFRFDDAEAIAPPSNAIKSQYPKSLLDLVYACVRTNPGDRIKLEDLFLEIQKHVGTCPTLKDLPLKFVPGLLGGEPLRCKPEPYADWAKKIN